MKTLFCQQWDMRGTFLEGNVCHDNALRGNYSPRTDLRINSRTMMQLSAGVGPARHAWDRLLQLPSMQQHCRGDERDYLHGNNDADGAL